MVVATCKPIGMTVLGLLYSTADASSLHTSEISNQIRSDRITSNQMLKVPNKNDTGHVESADPRPMVVRARHELNINVNEMLSVRV